MAQTPGTLDDARLAQLIQRQLPQITQRLHQTLEKLQVPREDNGENSLAAEVWWAQLQQRYANDAIAFCPVELDPAASVPASLFDSVADNLLHNALVKRQSENGLTIRVALACDATRMSVCDSGSAVHETLSAELLRAPVLSENGLGIGLYHAARQAGHCGYELRLASNVDGQVCFELKANKT